MKNDRFGINMKRFCREHEAMVTAAMEAGEATGKLLEEHLRMIAWVQHERLVRRHRDGSFVLTKQIMSDMIVTRKVITCLGRREKSRVREYTM